MRTVGTRSDQDGNSRNSSARSGRCAIVVVTVIAVTAMVTTAAAATAATAAAATAGVGSGSAECDEGKGGSRKKGCLEHWYHLRAWRHGAGLGSEGARAVPRSWCRSRRPA